MSGIPRVGVQAIVTKARSPRVVLLGRRRGGYGDGCWALPGGHLEFGESFENAARRELREETGLVAHTLTYWGSRNTYDPEAATHYVQIAVQVNSYEGTPTVLEPDKCYALDWFDLDNLPEVVFSPSVAFLERLRKTTSILASRRKPDELLLALYRLDEPKGMRRYCTYHLRGAPPLLQIRFGRYFESADRQVRTYTPETIHDALDIIRADLARRFSHKYRLLDFRGTLSLDEFRSLLPASWSSLIGDELPSAELLEALDQRLRDYAREGSQLSLFQQLDSDASHEE